MNISTSNTVRTLGIAIAVFVSLAIVFTLAPKVHAADLFDGGYDVYDYSGGYDTGYDIYDYSGGYDVYDYSSGYDTGYYTGGYSYGSGFTGGWSFGGGGSSGRSSSYSSSWAQSNTCTAVNSCNSYWDDHSVFNAPTNIVTNYPPAQTVTYAQPTYPIYTPAPVYTQPTYYPAPRPIAYNNTPYVTLAAVPYTGLELGTMGTIAYWGFLVLWCLIAAYLIVVKKVQNKIAAWFTGDATQNSASQKSSDLPSSGALRATPAGQTFVKQNSAPLFSGIDSFVLSQINRAK